MTELVNSFLVMLLVGAVIFGIITIGLSYPVAILGAFGAAFLWICVYAIMYGKGPTGPME